MFILTALSELLQVSPRLSIVHRVGSWPLARQSVKESERAGTAHAFLHRPCMYAHFPLKLVVNVGLTVLLHPHDFSSRSLLNHSLDQLERRQVARPKNTLDHNHSLVIAEQVLSVIFSYHRVSVVQYQPKWYCTISSITPPTTPIKERSAIEITNQAGNA
jgi:hypothetical protein